MLSPLVLVLLVLLSSLQPGRLQEEGCDDCSLFQNINSNIVNLNSMIRSYIRWSEQFRGEMEDNFSSLRADMSSLNDLVSNLRMCLQDHKQQAAAELAQLQASFNTTQSSLTQQVDDKLSAITASLSQHQQEIAAELAQLETSLTTTQSYLSQQVNTLTTNLSNHQQQTVSSVETANSKLDLLTATTAQLSTDHQQILTNISNVECMGTEESLQLHQNLQNNLTHQLETIKISVDQLPVHTCAGTGGWRRVVYLDMTYLSTTCPSGWQLTGYSKRTCGRASSGWYTCDSVTFPVSGGEYSRVCGRIKAYQWGAPQAFFSYHRGYRTIIDGAYVDGISVTHSSPRQHVWTFAAGITEGHMMSVHVMLIILYISHHLLGMTTSVSQE